MRSGHASTTAAIVSLARYIGSKDATLGRVCSDPIAQRLLPRGLRDVAQAAEHGPAWVFAALRRASLGLVDHIALRTAAIDAELERAVASGARQVVLLGAGLDARAYRLEALRDCEVFEVDHPDTQARKRRATQGLIARAARVHYVACDLRWHELESLLSRAGFDPATRSAWVWEGVTMYLERAAISVTLRSVARLCALDSTLISTYAHPKLALAGAALGRIGGFGLARLREPVRFTSTAQAYAALLAAHSFEVVSDRASPQLAAEAGIALPWLHFGMPYERTAVARRRGEEGCHCRQVDDVHATAAPTRA